MKFLADGSLPRQLTIEMENQRDWVHVVTDYYPDGTLEDYIFKKLEFREHEIAAIVRGILAGITYCHYNLKVIIGNLNPQGIVCDFKAAPHHTRIVSFNNLIAGSHRYVT